MIHIAKDFNWTSSSGGAASYELPENMRDFYLIAIKTAPGKHGDLTTNLPTADYDVVIEDGFEEDLAEGECADRSGTISESFYANPIIPITTGITIKITNAGNANEGKVRLVFSDER